MSAAILHSGDSVHIAVGLGFTPSMQDAKSIGMQLRAELEPVYEEQGVTIAFVTLMPIACPPTVVAVFRPDPCPGGVR